MDNIKNLELKFHAAMLNIYDRAVLECNYPATRFLDMVHEQGGFDAAKSLLLSKKLSDGFIELWKLKRLDLSMEALIVENLKFHPLFTKLELHTARKRLEDMR